MIDSPSSASASKIASRKVIINTSLLVIIIPANPYRHYVPMGQSWPLLTEAKRKNIPEKLLLSVQYQTKYKTIYGWKRQFQYVYSDEW